MNSAIYVQSFYIFYIIMLEGQWNNYLKCNFHFCLLHFLTIISLKSNNMQYVTLLLDSDTITYV